MIVAALTYALWSTVFIVGKEALKIASPLFLIGTRMLFGGAVLLIALFVKNKRIIGINKVDALPLMALAVLGMYLANTLEFVGLMNMAASRTCLLYGLCPFFSMIISAIHLNEKITRRKLLWITVGFCAFIPTFIAKSALQELSMVPSLSDLMVLLCDILTVYGWVITRKLSKSNRSIFYTNGYSMIIGGAFAIGHSLFFDTWNPIPLLANKMPIFIGSNLYMVAVSNIICYNIQMHLLKKYTATELSLVGMLSPLILSAIEWIFYDISPPIQLPLSAIVLAFAIFMIHKEETKIAVTNLAYRTKRHAVTKT